VIVNRGREEEETVEGGRANRSVGAIVGGLSGMWMLTKSTDKIQGCREQSGTIREHGRAATDDIGGVLAWTRRYRDKKQEWKPKEEGDEWIDTPPGGKRLGHYYQQMSDKCE